MNYRSEQKANKRLTAQAAVPSQREKNILNQDTSGTA
jgi:hypothetical protein